MDPPADPKSLVVLRHAILVSQVYGADMNDLQDSLNFLTGCRANCHQIEEFIGVSVQPIVERTSNNMPYGQVCSTLLLRVRAWLGTLSKLDSPTDFQAVHAASRSIFETAIDMVLILHQEKQDITKLLAWERSAKLRAAERMVESTPNSKALKFIECRKDKVQTERNLIWPTRDGKPRSHPERWTGRDLRRDAEKAESYLSAGFVRFYLERYSTTCWNVHGSGAAGIWDLRSDAFPDICSMAMKSACEFALVCVEYSLRLFDAFDEISEARLKRLREEMLLNAHAIWKSYHPELAGNP